MRLAGWRRHPGPWLGALLGMLALGWPTAAALAQDEGAGESVDTPPENAAGTVAEGQPMEEEKAAEEDEEEVEEGAPKDKSAYGPIQKRLFALDNELAIGFSYLPLDPFAKGYGVHLSYTIHLDDIWALELLRVGFAWNVDTSLKSKILDTMPTATPEEFPQVVFWENTNLVAKILYGKQSIMNSAVVHFDLFLVGGLALCYRNPFNVHQLDTDNSRFDLGVDLGVGFRFWLSPAWSLRVDIRDTLLLFGVNSLDFPLENSVEISLALAVNL